MKPSRELKRLNVADIYIGERQRALRDESVTALAASMGEIGLMTPISVRLVEGPTMLDGEEVWDVPHLIAGAHRLAAAKQLGWDKIDCFMLEADDLDAQIWEVDENLSRAELTTDEKRTQLRLRKELWEARKKSVAHDAPAKSIGYKSPPTEKGFASETAERTGMSKSQINRLLADPKPTPIRTGVEKTAGVDASETRLKAAQNAYNRLQDDERRAFHAWLEEHEAPVFDMSTSGRAA